MFRNLRLRIGKYYLRREQAHTERHLQISNLYNARRIGILYLLDDVPDYDRVVGFVTQLQMEHKEVKALGFVKEKQLVQRFLPKLSYDFFSSKDVNWIYRPVHTKVRDFIEMDFDLLIDLSIRDLFPIKYIAGLSKACCRVGKFSEENKEYFDLMIDWKPSMTIDDFLGQVRYYLTIINPNEEN